MKDWTEVDWKDVSKELDTQGFARMNGVLTPAECDALIGLYSRNTLFRSTIDMKRYRFGLGEYRYFNYPLPEIVENLRKELYARLAPTATEWMQRLDLGVVYPPDLEDFIDECHAKGQLRPTPLILRYLKDGYNTLHQDLYGDVFFPFQVVLMLSEPERDFKGGELVFVEQLPRAQSRATVVKPRLGDAVVFTTNFRPVNGTRGFYRGRMKHGVSAVTAGVRYTMGIIFHDAI